MRELKSDDVIFQVVVTELIYQTRIIVTLADQPPCSLKIKGKEEGKNENVP